MTNQGLQRLQLPSHLVGLSVAQMRGLGPLPYDAQKLIDNAVIRVGLERLTVVADLLAEGLTYNITDPMSITEVQWESVSKTGHAQRVMSPEARGEYQLPGRTVSKLPVYITMDDFSLGVRTLGASQRAGQPLDTFMVEEATRRVNEAIEDAAINGAGIVVGGMTTPGIINAPNVNTMTYETNTAWDSVSKTGQDIVDDVLTMINALQTARKYGPYNLYVPTTYGTALSKNFSDGTTTFAITIRQRLEQIEAGGRNLRIRVADRLPANRTAMIQMTSDVIDIVDGQRPVVVPWTSASGFTLFWAVMAIQVPRVRSDFDGNSGIVVGNV